MARKTPADRLYESRAKTERAAILFVLDRITCGGNIPLAVSDAATAIGVSPAWLTARVLNFYKSHSRYGRILRALHGAGLLPIAAE
jgi:hypothetical protein